MARKFSDLHCHNHMRAHFQMQEKRKKFERKGEFSPWTVIASNKKNHEAGKMGASYSQIDLVKCWNSNLRLTFNSMYPLERDFVKGMKPQIGEDKWYKFLIAFATSHKLPLRDFIQVAYMKIPDRMVDYVQSSDYDYWESLNREFEFVSMDSGKVIPKNEIYLPGNLLGRKRAELKRARQYPKEYLATNSSYRIPKTKQELENSLTNPNEITMVLSIEGAHSFGTDRVQSIQEVSDRIKHMKKEWDYPVFFITFAHHFDNKLCGHAHSIPDSGKLLLNQRKRMNQGFNNNGRRIIKEILGLNNHLEKDTELGYRTLIDVKHMSARSRQEYYAMVKDCLAKGDRIPVIASHCGYSGISTLDKHIELEGKEKDDYTDPSGKFNAWNINMCDEDIEIIAQTRGLFGLSFDQRILGITKKDKNTSRNGIQLIWENIEGILKSAFENPNLSDSEKRQIWKSLTIGTDFEGLIDPVNPYPTALEFEQFSENLISIIDQERRNAGKAHLAHLKSKEDVEKAVNDFCYNNSESFVLENFPDKKPKSADS
ncbi:membrane dipeptidase [Algoriphagus sp. CAU 1675]|uniref:membrane dipeptidase n=1 Tax=Algoriphagus sp. CAU 1675 TaxID=3032597 RepID=UPI0023DBB213|nr:membrane dipeptidase [Algoriphagus sp. CAU 1675]MDF2157724.1 membrane dipeptidase [Algoriphagus sp. CAU 1675]